MCCGEAPSKKPVPDITKESRGCVDLLHLLIYITGWIGILTIFYISMKNGNPNRITKGVNMEAKICGIDDEVVDKPFAAWPNTKYYKYKICVADCSETLNDTRMYVGYHSQKFLTYCLPTGKDVNGNFSKIDDNFGQASQMASRAMGDLIKAWHVILLSAVFSLVCSFIYCYFVKSCASCFIWTCLFLILFAGTITGYVFLESAKEIEASGINVDRAKALKWIGIIILIVTGLFALIVCGLRKRISIASEVVSEAASSVGDMKSLILFPIILFVFLLGYFAFWISVTVYLFSVATMEPRVTEPALLTNALGQPTGLPTNGFYFKWDEGLKSSFAYVFFHLLWSINFITYFGYMVLAGAVADWYFARRDNLGEKIRGDGEHELSNSPVSESFSRTLASHIGTVSFGAIIISIVQFMRACIEYVEKVSKSPEPNQVQRCVLASIKCCLKCSEVCLQKVSHNAIVWSAIYGDPFIASACNSFSLLWRNLARVAAINMVGAYLLLIGKLLVALLSTGICAMIFENSAYFQQELSSPVMPLVMCFILAYAVAALFMVVFETAIDTTFLCFLVDEECHENKNDMFARPELRDLVDKYYEQSQEIAQKKQGINSQTPPNDGYNKLED